jgi:hypothetical protein
VSEWYPGKFVDYFLGNGYGSAGFHLQTAQDRMNDMRNQYINRWKSEGLTDNQIALSLRLASEWANGMASMMSRYGAKVSQDTLVDLYSTALGVADRWARAIFK